jgi:hypothetical protein
MEDLEREEMAQSKQQPVPVKKTTSVGKGMDMMKIL